MDRKVSWRGIGMAVAFVVLAIALLIGSDYGRHLLGIQFHDKNSPVETPISIAGTYLALAMTVFATWIMARIERRSWLDFGLRGGPRAGRQFGQGLLVGVAAMLGIALAIHFAGGMTIRIANLTPGAGGLALIWTVGFFGIGLFEETLFRGYFFKRLDEAAPFPTAIVVTSLLFGLAHMSSGFDAGLALFDAVLVAGILAISIQLTGSLWWAIGFHAAWDWTESYVLGAADSGIRAEGALFHADPAGPVWLSGGASGPEGSVLTFVAGAIALILMLRRLRAMRG